MFLTDSTPIFTRMGVPTVCLTDRPYRDAGHRLGKHGLGVLWQLYGPHNTQPAQYDSHPTI